jgi:CBS-domain-containing membrane protein
MSVRKLYDGNFVSLKDSDTVGEAIRRMLDSRVSDLPVVDADGRLAGLFRVDRLYAELLPRAAQLPYGMPDLSFVHDSLDDLAGRLREFSDRPVRDFVVPAEHVVKPGVSPVEVVLLLYRGANSIPVVGADGRLVDMVTARDVLAALAR